MAKAKATTPEQIDLMRKDLKAELVQMNGYLKAARDTDTETYLKAEIARISQALESIKEDSKEVAAVAKQEKEKKAIEKEPLSKTVASMAKEIGKNLAIARGAQKNLEDIFHNNRELVDIYKKDESKGKMLIDVAIKNQAKALAMVTGMKAEVLEKQIKASTNIAEALKTSQEPLFAMKRSMVEMAKTVQHNLKKWPLLGRFFTDAMIEHYAGIVNEIKGIIGHHMKNILAPIEILLEPFKTMFKIGGILVKFFKNPKPTMTEKSTAKWQSKIDTRLGNLNDTLLDATGYARKSWELAEDEAKAARRQVTSKKKGPMFWIASILGLVAGAIAGLIGGVQIQAFGYFSKTIGNILKSIKGKGMAAIEGIAKFFTNLGKRFKSLKPLIEGAKRVFSMFSRGFIGGFLRGLKWIAWPITLLMTVIDAIKGFKEGFESQGGGSGGIISGIVQGLGEAVKGFLYLPVKLFGWVADKLMGMIGVEIDGGSAGMIFEVIDKIFGAMEFMFHTIYNGLIGLIAEMVGAMPFGKGLADKIRGWRTGQGLNADPEKKRLLEEKKAEEQKAVKDRTIGANEPEKARAMQAAKAQRDLIEVQKTEGGETTLKETVSEMGDKISSSVMTISKTAQKAIPTAPEETYLALMGDAVGGA